MDSFYNNKEKIWILTSNQVILPYGNVINEVWKEGYRSEPAVPGKIRLK